MIFVSYSHSDKGLEESDWSATFRRLPTQAIFPSGRIDKLRRARTGYPRSRVRSSSARAAVLLISVDFLNSSFIQQI